MEQIKNTGLCEAEVIASQKSYGSNVLTKKKQKTISKSFVENLGDPVIRVLIISLVVNITFTFKNIDWLETGGIAVAIFLATLISTLSEHSSQLAFEKLNSQVKCTVRVRRNNKITELPADEIVVGDVVLISAGEKICADGFLIRGKVSLDQSAITGESKESVKHPLLIINETQELSPSSPNACLSGCTVSSGEGEILIKRVGDASFLGSIVSELQANTRESPLKLRLSRLAKQISALGYTAAVLIALLNLFSTICIESDFVREVMISKLSDPKFLVGEILHSITLGLTVIIMAVPEGLPMMIAVVLSSNVQKMLRDNVLVRKQTGIEAAGSMNLLFTDKIGTLTKGKMSIESFILPNGQRIVGIQSFKTVSLEKFTSFCENAVYNSSSKLENSRVLGGNATERALLEAAKRHVKLDLTKITHKLPFDSANKYSLATLKNKTYIKGAPEVVMPMLNDDELDALAVERAISSAQSEGKRVILMAQDHKFTCAAVISDSPRKEARASVEALKSARIDVVMITGDGALTAKSIASQTGIINSRRDLCLTHDQIEKMTDEELCDALPRLAAVARAHPQDKTRLVRIAQSKDLVVGMTGDGINDAPALRLADVGFAMGSGTDVAKEAGDIVILDNNLASIVKAVLYGRNTFKSIRKFLVFQLTMNFSSALLCMIAPFFGIESPITVTQMLWVNMIMDTLGGLAFAGEAPQKRIMKEKPKRRDEPILNAYMAHQILISGTFSAIFSLMFLKLPFFTSHIRKSENDLVLLSAFFALFIFLSIAQCVNSRTDRLNLFVGITKNPTFIVIMLLICAIQISFVYLGGAALRTTPLTLHELIFTMACSLLAIIFEFFRKIIWRFSGKTEGF